MSRYSEGDYDQGFPGEYDLRRANLERALKGKRGQKALAELREALLALPDRRLIAGAMCTVNFEKRAQEIPEQWGEREDFIEDAKVEGVCAIGAYLWHRRVKAGADPQEAFDSLPTLYGHDAEDNLDRTAEIAARDLGIVNDLAWDLAFRNDETLGDCTPGERWTRYMAWLDSQLGAERVSA